MIIRPPEPADAAAIAAIYNYYIRTSHATFELDEIDAAEMQRRIDEAAAAGDEVRIVFSGPRSALADLNAMLVGEGIRVMSLREEEPDLEQVFLTVTGDHQAGEDAEG